MSPMFYSPADPQHIKKERQNAKDLRKTQWWDSKLSQGLCHYCEKTFSRDLLTMDHIVPIARGGKSTRGNIVVSCKECNSKKSTQTAAELALSSI